MPVQQTPLPHSVTHDPTYIKRKEVEEKLRKRKEKKKNVKTRG